MNSANITKFLVEMIVMMNPLGSLSIFLQLTKGFAYKRQRIIALHASLAMIIIMFLTLWTGERLLDLLGISLSSFRFAGGIILLLMGLSMLQSQESSVNHSSDDNAAARESESIAVVPVALPLIIGPGAISTMIITVNDFSSTAQKLCLSSICLGLALSMGLLLYFAQPIARFVGASAIKVITRIMGMVIMSVAAGMLSEGLIGLIPALG